MTDNDHPDTDLTDPHGEAEALRRENARLREELASGSFYKEADIDALMARAEAAEAALAASRAPDPVVNAGSCQPGDRYQHIKRGTTYQVIACGKLQTDTPLTDYADVVAYRCDETGDVWVRPQSEFTPDRFRALPAAPVAEAQPTIGGAELNALVKRLHKLARDMKRDAPYDWDEHEDVLAAAYAITALRAQPDWKAMAERLGEAAKFGVDLIEGDSFGSEWKRGCSDFRRIARAALSEFAKMNGATK